MGVPAVTLPTMGTCTISRFCVLLEEHSLALVLWGNAKNPTFFSTLPDVHVRLMWILIQQLGIFHVQKVDNLCLS